MSGHRVTLVIRETVTGMALVERPHGHVALDFREDGGGRDAGGLGVALDDGLLRDIDLLQPLRVDQQVLGRQRESPDRPLHGLDARPINVDRVDLLDLHERHTPTLCLCLDLLRELLAGRSVEFLRVVDPDYPSGKVVRTEVFNDGCLFLAHDRRGCAIHRASLEQGWDYNGVKPAICRLFPLSYEEDQIVIADEYVDYSCAHKDGITVYQQARQAIHDAFGPELVAAMDAAEAKVLAAQPKRLPVL